MILKKKFKKGLLILLSFLVFSFSLLQTQQKNTAYAITGVEEAVAVGGSAYAAAGVYVGMTLLVAAGAGVLGLEYSDEIKTHATSVWNKVDSTTKTAFNAAVDTALTTGSKTISLTSDMAAGLKTALASSVEWLKRTISEKQLNDNLGLSYSNIFQAAATTLTFDAGTNAVSDLTVTINGIVYQGMRLYIPSGNSTIRLEGWNGTSWLTTGYNISTSHSALGWGSLSVKNFAYSGDNTFDEMIVIMDKMGAIYSLGYGTVPPSAPISESINNNINNLTTTQPLNLAIDSWSYETPTGFPLEWRPDTNTWEYENGDTYSGPVVVDVPVPYTPSGSSTYDAPTVGLDNVLVGELGTSVTSDSPTAETTGSIPSTGDTSGILQGLWDWLKGILQSILDAIKALAGAIAALFLPTDTYFENLFKDIKAKFDSKLPFIAALAALFASLKDAVFSDSIPEFKVTMPADWGGGTYSIIDFSYFSDYRVWILNFVRFSAWYFFLKRLYNRIPKIVY